MVEVIQGYLKKDLDTKIILSFREDYLAPIQYQLDQSLSHPYKQWYIRPLDETGIREAIEVPLQKDCFQLKVYPEFVEDMIYLLLQDKSSNIAPSLQIILYRLWQAAPAKQITRELFDQHIRKEGIILEQFIQDNIQLLEQKTW